MITIYLLISILSLFIAMLCRSLVHQVTFNYPRTKERIKKLFGVEISDQWWNPFESWLNKNKIKWTIDVFGLRWITKVMVQFSDAFHTFNTIELGCYSLIISLWIIFALAFPWWSVFIFFLFIGIVLMGGFFVIGYDKIWNNN